MTVKRMKLPLVLGIVLMFSMLTACGADDIKHEKSAHWDVSLQRSTGSYGIVYIGDESTVKDFVYNVIGPNFERWGRSLAKQPTPVTESGVLNPVDNKEPITFNISWNDKSESITFD
ncbi:hypothetical protein Q9R46_02070 [Paenibacillus sp. RRE4]|uniref:hypothetical protein n=1 Tax=Paenibacillus sp. RRE4 TaxID=2962587 RepID=UPI002882A4A7|nr:hypothetical protein [Paenibacillus sp. RRE4]MDT0121416.1 hypothetical protein [Paenibacillus sp. RRE4]